MQAPTPRLLNSAALALAALALIGTALSAPPASAHPVDDAHTPAAPVSSR